VRNPYEGNRDAVADGERLWNWYNCSGCHSAGAGGGMGPPLIDSEWIYGGDDARVFESIWNGRQAGMPAWAGLIPQDDVWKIVAFIRQAPRRDAWPWNGSTPVAPASGTSGDSTGAAASAGGSPSASNAPLTVEMTGRQWWWDIVYKGNERGDDARTANELHLPAGRPVRLVVRSADASFTLCAPILERDIDLEPGGQTVVDVQARDPGTSIGTCRDPFGNQQEETQRMRIQLVVQPSQEFDAWLDTQRGPATDPADEFAARGRDEFLRRCVVCHAVRGTPARGRVAPDLTHVASRRQIANGVLGSRIGDYEAWIAGNETIKPGNLMPSFRGMDGVTLRAIGRYLGSLR
jgi:heme/copper-type cytochrome/quinol oxidase subunit 2